MVIHGHVENGVVIPHDAIALPNGTEVTITVPTDSGVRADEMSQQEQQKYRAALARIDATANENPGDTFRGADHDRVLYGDRSRSSSTRESGLRDSCQTIQTTLALQSGLPRMTNCLSRPTIAPTKL
jgi:hypothetical protein